MRIAVLITWLPSSAFRFSEALEAVSGSSVDTIGGPFPRRRTALRKLLMVWPLYALVPMRFIAKMNQYQHVVCWQQAYGIVLGILLRALPIRVACRIHIMTFIVVPKKRKGLWVRLISYALGCQNVESVVVHNPAELILYRQLFPEASKKFHFVMYTAADVPERTKFVVEDRGFVLAVGRSNRDNSFLIDYFSRRPTKRLVILTDDSVEDDLPENVTVMKGVYGVDYYAVLAKCHAVVMAFKDPTISAGQLVFLQALQFGKPVVVTESECLFGYVEDGINGVIATKSWDGMDKAFQTLEDPGVYRRLASRGPVDYVERFGFHRLAAEMFALIR